MYKEKEIIKFSKQFVVCVTVHPLATKNPSALFSYTLNSSPRNITRSSIPFLHAAQSTDLWVMLDFCIRLDVVACGSLKNKIIDHTQHPAPTHSITMVKYEQNNYNKHA